MLLDTVFTRTRQGAVAMADQTVPMSGGFRRLLALVNGKNDGKALLAALPQLDEEDLQLWTSELVRMGLIAIKGNLTDEEAAFSLTTEMPAMMRPPSAVTTGDLIEQVSSNVAGKIAPPLNAAIEKKLSKTTRMAAIESVSSFPAMGKAGFFVYPDTATGLPAAPRVCLATHDPLQGKLLGLLIKQIGGVAESAASRDALLAVLRAPAPPHVLFLDAELPGIDGFRALESIRAKPSLKNLRVVLVSSRGERADLAQAMLLGAAGYIVKPLKREILQAAIPQIFGKALR